MAVNRQQAPSPEDSPEIIDTSVTLDPELFTAEGAEEIV